MSVVVIVSPDRDAEGRVSAAVRDPATVVIRLWRGEYTRIDPTKIVDDAVDAGAAVVCIGPRLPVDGTLALAEAFDQRNPEICVLLLAEPTDQLWQRALNAGVRGVVEPAAPEDELAAALDAALRTAEGRRRVPTSDQHDGPSARTIAVLSPKGGSGKSTIATNLGVGIARRPGGNVALVDLDLQFGDVAPYLQLVPEASIADAARAPEALDSTMLKVFLTAHPSGLYALCGPASPAEADDVSFDQAVDTVRLLAAEFEVVIVDTGGDLGDATLAAVEAATDLLFVCSTDVASVRSLRKELDALDRLGTEGRRRHLVLNRADARVGARVADIEDVLGMTACVEIPSARSVPVALNQGVAVVEAYPRSPVARQLTRLVDMFAGNAAAPRDHDGDGSGRRRWRRS